MDAQIWKQETNGCVPRASTEMKEDCHQKNCTLEDLIHKNGGVSQQVGFFTNMIIETHSWGDSDKGYSTIDGQPHMCGA